MKSDDGRPHPRSATGVADTHSSRGASKGGNAPFPMARPMIHRRHEGHGAWGAYRSGLLGWFVLAACASQAAAETRSAGSAVPSSSLASPPGSAGAATPGPGSSSGDAPEVSDPMLAPPPPAPREVKSWDEALELLRARSPDYITGYESVLRASAQSRMALAASLPTLNGQGSYAHQFFTLSVPFDGAVLVSPPKDTFAATGTLQWTLSPR